MGLVEQRGREGSPWGAYTCADLVLVLQRDLPLPGSGEKGCVLRALGKHLALGVLVLLLKPA